MITKLEPLITTDFKVGEPTSLDLYDTKGMLLLSKGQRITEYIHQLLLRRQLCTLKYCLDNYQTPNQEHKFSSSEYQFIVGFIREIFKKAHLFRTEHLIETFPVVNRLIDELEGPTRVYIDLNEFRKFDNYTYVHSVNVAVLAALIGMQMGYTRQELNTLTLGAMFHDLGKCLIPLDILNKPSGLVEEEFRFIKKHPVLGEEMLKFSEVPSEIIGIIRHHHERWNGEGYPDGLRERAITMNAQIVAIADVFDALVADRPYRKGIPPYHALEIIIAGSGKDFNKDIVNEFIKCLVLYPKGSIVYLNTGEIGTVVGMHQNYPSRPLVKILFDKNGNYNNGEYICDLLEDLTRFIQSVDFPHLA